MRGALRLRARIAITAVTASAAALLTVLLLVGPRLRESSLEHTRQELFADARLMARVVEEPLARGAGPEELDPLIDSAAQDVRARVTIILPDGRVVADSANSGAALLAEENHKNRPEVREALRSGAGSSERHSVTVDDDLVYTAVAIEHDGKVLGVSRVALSASGIEAQASALRSSVAVALALAFLITAVLSLLLSSSLIGPLGEIMDTARQLAAGNFSARIRVTRRDELGELAKILNDSAEQLQERLTEIARDRARTDAILSAMGDGVLAVDHRGIVVLANRSLRRALELDDPVGRHHVEVIRQREVGDVLEEVLRSGQLQAVEVELLHTRRAFSLTGVPFPGDEGIPPGAVLTFHDITEGRRLERIRRDFVANASHELRTPLTSIRGFVEALEDGAVGEPDTAARFLGKIRTHADRMAALVEDLLELSRLEAGERPPQWEEIPPSEIVEDVAASFAAAASRKDIVLTKTDEGAPSVMTDADRLRRVLENLVDNAIKYTPPKGQVEIVSSRGPNDGVILQVKDNGPGIGSEHLPRIFERFYRVDKARSRELGGTGLGLAIVKHLAEGMGATVSVASELGRGTVFTVWVPLRPDVV